MNKKHIVTFIFGCIFILGSTVIGKILDDFISNGVIFSIVLGIYFIIYTVNDYISKKRLQDENYQIEINDERNRMLRTKTESIVGKTLYAFFFVILHYSVYNQAYMIVAVYYIIMLRYDNILKREKNKLEKEL